MVLNEGVYKNCWIYLSLDEEIIILLLLLIETNSLPQNWQYCEAENMTECKNHVDRPQSGNMAPKLKLLLVAYSEYSIRSTRNRQLGAHRSQKY